MIARLVSYLVVGSQDSRLDESWFENRARLAQYQSFTDRQLLSCVVKDVAATKRERFWQRMADQRMATALPFPRRMA